MPRLNEDERRLAEAGVEFFGYECDPSPLNFNFHPPMTDEEKVEALKGLEEAFQVPDKPNP